MDQTPRSRDHRVTAKAKWTPSVHKPPRFYWSFDRQNCCDGDLLGDMCGALDQVPQFEELVRSHPRKCADITIVGLHRTEESAQQPRRSLPTSQSENPFAGE